MKDKKWEEINEEVARCIKAVGEDLIKRADDISRDLKNVVTITINAQIDGGKIITYDVTKNYNTLEYIHYHKKEDK